MHEWNLLYNLKKVNLKGNTCSVLNKTPNFFVVLYCLVFTCSKF